MTCCASLLTYCLPTFSFDVQFQNILEELSRAAEKFLEEASKYGEVSFITVLVLLACRDWHGMLRSC